MGRSNPEGYQAPLLRDGHRATYGFEQGFRIADVMVAWKDEQHFIPIDVHRGQSDRRGGPTRTGFEKQPGARRESRNFVSLARRAHDNRRQKEIAIPDTCERLLDHRSTTDDFEEMLGPIFGGNRPQSRSPAPREHDRLNSFHHA